MITYDHLWWIKSTYDGWRRLKMLFWRKPALTPTKNYENKTVCVFFQGASDGNAPGCRNINQKLRNNEKLFFSETWIFQVWPNRPILRESKAVHPRMILTLFWVGFNWF